MSAWDPEQRERGRKKLWSVKYVRQTAGRGRKLDPVETARVEAELREREDRRAQQLRGESLAPSVKR